RVLVPGGGGGGESREKKAESSERLGGRRQEAGRNSDEKIANRVHCLPPAPCLLRHSLLSAFCSLPPHSSPLLILFFSLRIRFSFRRAARAAREGRVGMRLRGLTRARRSISARRISAALRLRSWLRYSLATTRITPSASVRLARRWRRCSRCSSES